MNGICYAQWLRTREPSLFLSQPQVEAQIAGFSHRPLFSILLLVVSGSREFLPHCVRSMQAQLYREWQLCVVHDDLDPTVLGDELGPLASDERILLFNNKEGGIRGSVDHLFKGASGDWILPVNQNDELHAHALFEIAAALNREADLDLVYSDEDQLDSNGHRTNPAFKPGFDLDAFLSFNYLRRPIALRRSLAVRLGNLRSWADAGWDWDLLMRAIEQTTPDKIFHIAKTLCHRHTLQAASPSAAYAPESVLIDRLARTAATGVEVQPGVYAGSLRLKRAARETTAIAIFLRTEDGPYQRAVLAPYAGRFPATFYELLGSSVTTGEPGSEQWVWSLGEIEADIFLFINRPLETVNHDFLDELVSQASRPDCGLVTGLSIDRSTVISSGFLYNEANELVDPFAGLQFPQDGYLGLLSVVRAVETIADEFFAVGRTHLQAVGGLGSISACFMPRLAHKLAEHAHEQQRRVLVTPYAVATFEGVVFKSRPLATARANRHPIRINANVSTLLKSAAEPMPVL